MRYIKHSLLIISMSMVPLIAHAGPPSPCEAQDKAEDGAEAVGSFFERNWEKLEDAVIPETEEERREEAAERAEDAAEEAREREKCR